jgi:hypothetical protein
VCLLLTLRHLLGSGHKENGYGVRGVLQRVNRFYIMEGPCSVAILHFLGFHHFLASTGFLLDSRLPLCSFTPPCHLLLSLGYIDVGRFLILEVGTNSSRRPTPARPTSHPTDHLPLQDSQGLHQLREQGHSYLSAFLEWIGSLLSSSPKPLSNPDPGSSPPCQSFTPVRFVNFSSIIFIPMCWHHPSEVYSSTIIIFQYLHDLQLPQ